MRTIITVAIICLVLGFSAAHWSQNRATKSKPAAEAVKEQPLRAATLAEQKMCDEQATKKFREDNPKREPNSNDMTNYRSHYDPKANICYIRVDSTIADKNSISNLVMIYDAFEGRGYGSYTWINNQHKKYWEVSPVECSVQPLGKQEIKCSSIEEFNRLAETHFGIGDTAPSQIP